MTKKDLNKIYYILYILIILGIISAIAVTEIKQIRWDRIGYLFGNLFPTNRTDIEEILSFIGQHQTVIIRESFLTIFMALAGTTFGTIISFAVGFLSSSNLFPSHVTHPFRIFATIVRTIPTLVYAVLFVVIFGLGRTAGLFALITHTIGYSARLLSDSFEEVASEKIIAARISHYSKLGIFLMIVFPESLSRTISIFFFELEMNVKSASVLGLVGAGGIGFYLDFYLRMFNWTGAFVYLFVIIVLINLAAIISVVMRRHLLKTV